MELVKEKKNGGILEKYYKSKATRFVIQEEDSSAASSISTNLMLNQEEREQFLLELEQLIVRWESQLKSSGNKQEYKVSCAFEVVKES
ncbi:hypothetical protein FGG79_19115 [Bacillus sp. BHET2]|uniref:hypothetical protein n=1 Tax=Bacillus sp. BHET2 TaxID=2583818 RepID=UPI00110EFA49|nr:hypothetical protein [Bacillus sp. BHET2]TMU83543.1 hypothetical protein FGG79_19115 [Bacillus sp. BHET2]